MADLGEQTPLDRLFRGVWIEEIIEKVFRFFEMIVVATLIGVVMRVVSVDGSKWLSGGLAFAAGLYLGIPTARWIYSRIRPPIGRNLGMVVLISLAFGMAATQMTYPLRILLSATFKIDERVARIDYKLWQARSGLRDCRAVRRNGPPPPPPPAIEIRFCEQGWKSEIGRLEAEKQALER